MISIYNIKPAFQNFLRPVVKGLVSRGVTPNHLTIAAIVGSFVVGGIVFLHSAQPGWLLLYPFWLFLRMALNALDGMAAREHAMMSKLGAVLNEVGDVISDVALYLPLAVVSPAARWPVFFFTLGSVLNELCGLLGQALGGKRHYEGPMGKSDRAFVVGAVALFSPIFPVLFSWWPVIFWMGFALEIFSCINRLKGALRD